MTIDDQSDPFEAFAAQGSGDLLQLATARQGSAAGPGGDATDPQPFLPCFGSLEEWVVSVFAPTYARRTTPTFRWCGEWWRHPEAISRLEALWRSWEALRLDPLLGMSTWYASHLDHQLPILTAAAGPFAECDPTRHFPPETDRLAHTSAPADWWPPSRG